MAPFALILAAFALLHLPGLRRWPGGPRPSDKAAGALGLVLLFTGTLHFTRPAAFEQMVPPFLPTPGALVAVSGIAELAIGLGLLLPRTRRPAGWAAVALLVAVWAANVWVAWGGAAPEDFSQDPLRNWLRVPFQLLYIGWAIWCALGHLPGRGLRRRLLARYYDRVQARYDAHVAGRRRELLAGLQGAVLEIGPGTGANLTFLPEGVSWTGVEPNPHMRARLRARAAELGVTADLRDLDADRLPAEDASVDAVLSTLVLCSVPDHEATLREIRRVLKPGGRFVFLEHVAAPRGTRLRRVQRLLSPTWQFLADGCCPDRETGEAIRRAGFSALELEEFRMPREAAAPIVAPHVSGVGVR